MRNLLACRQNGWFMIMLTWGMIHRACISLHIPHPFKRVRRIDTTIARDYRLGFAFSALGDVAIAGPLLLSKSDFEDFPPDSSESEYTGDVDWDEEWKKVVKGENQPVARPRGNDIGEMERATRKAKREAEMQFMKIKANAKKGLNFQSLQGDWKFWIGIIAVISVATSLIAASGQGQFNDESFYV